MIELILVNLLMVGIASGLIYAAVKSKPLLLKVLFAIAALVFIVVSLPFAISDNMMVIDHLHRENHSITPTS